MNTLPFPPPSALRRDRSLPRAVRAPAPALPSHLAPPTLALAPGEVHSRIGAAGSRLRVQAGRVWLTETDDAQDHFLGPGDSHPVRGPGLLVVEALGADVAVLVWEAR